MSGNHIARQGEPGVSNVAVSEDQLPRWLSVLGGMVRFSLGGVSDGNLTTNRTGHVSRSSAGSCSVPRSAASHDYRQFLRS
ncbi:hypothetical protein FALCPG4_000999 [Fusarium falciforme]